MFKFFTNKRWYPWSIFGSLIILVSTWYQVQLDVMINEWFGEFYDTLQKALTTPNSVTEKEFISYLLTFAKIGLNLAKKLFCLAGIFFLMLIPFAPNLTI